MEQGIKLLKEQGILNKYIGSNHYTTGSGALTWGSEKFHYTNGIVINTKLSFKQPNSDKWRIVAYHGTEWCNLNSILKDGLLPGNPTDCQTFSGSKYGKGVYVSPYQSYAKLYNRGTPKRISSGRVRLVLGLRIKDSHSITKTTDEKIWLIKDETNVSVQDINLTFD